MRVPWTASRSNQSVLMGISLEYSLEGLVLKLKFQYFGHLMQRPKRLGKDLDAWEDGGKEEKRVTEDGMVGLHHRVNGYEFEQTQGDK